MTAPDIKQRIADMCADAAGGTPAELGARISREIAIWHKVVRQSGMAVDCITTRYGSGFLRAYFDQFE